MTTRPQRYCVALVAIHCDRWCEQMARNLASSIFATPAHSFYRQPSIKICRTVVACSDPNWIRSCGSHEFNGCPDEYRWNSLSRTHHRRPEGPTQPSPVPSGTGFFLARSVGGEQFGNQRLTISSSRNHRQGTPKAQPSGQTKASGPLRSGAAKLRLD